MTSHDMFIITIESRHLGIHIFLKLRHDRPSIQDERALHKVQISFLLVSRQWERDVVTRRELTECLFTVVGSVNVDNAVPGSEKLRKKCHLHLKQLCRQEPLNSRVSGHNHLVRVGVSLTMEAMRVSS